MENLALNFYSGVDLTRSYIKLGEFLAEERMFMQECFNYESACRLQDSQFDNDFFIQKIFKINEMTSVNSFQTYSMQKSTLHFEFPISNLDGLSSIILNKFDRYIALMHIMLMLDVEDDISFIEFIWHKSKAFKNSIMSELSQCNQDFSNHIKDVISSAEENVINKFLLYPNNLNLMKIALELEPNNPYIYLNIIKFYLMIKANHQAMLFYNEQYAKKFNFLQVRDIIEVYNFMISYLASNRKYFDALFLEHLKANYVIGQGGRQNDKN